MARLSAIAGVLVLCLALCLADTSQAQDEVEPPGRDLTLPPQIDQSAIPAPGDAQLEEAPEDRDDLLTATVTGGQTDFRLPDLGTSFREEEIDPNQRISVKFLNLYDPENRDPTAELFPTIEDMRRVGFLQIFRMSFGRRSRD